MAVTLNTDTGSVVAQAGQQVDVASLLDITAGSNPTYLVVSLLDRDEYTAASNGNTGTLSDNGQTIGLSNIGGDNDTVGIVFTFNASTGQYTNATYGNLANLIYTASTNTNDNTSISFFTTNNASLANESANSPSALESYAPAYTSYVGSISVVTQPSFGGPALTQATPDSVEAAAMSFVGKAWNMDGCWVLACNISAEAGASLPITSTSLGIPGVASGEWIVAYNGPAGQTGNWEAQITAGEMVVFETSATSGHITTVVSGSGSSAMLVDNATVYQNGQIINSANDGSANDIIISAPNPASQEWEQAAAGSVVVYELDCPIITVTTAVSTDAAGKTTALAPLFSASNPLAGQAITEYQFYDVGTGGAASNSFMVGSTDEVSHSVTNAITVNSSALSTVDLLAGSSSGTDTIDVRAFNGSYWGDWVSMTVDITGTANALSPPTPAAPTVTAQTPNQTWAQGEAVDLALAANTFTDPQQEALSYSATLASGAALPAWLHFNANTESFTGSVPSGASGLDIEVTATDTSGLSASETFAVATPSGPSVNASSFTVAVQQSVAASPFFTISNPSNDNITEYSFKDNGGGSGYFTLAGTAEPDGQVITVSASNLSGVQYVGGSSAGTDTLTVDAYDATTGTWIPSVSLSAVTTAAYPLANITDVTEALYIGYFGRAGDPGGVAYWVTQLNAGIMSEASTAASFFGAN
jgi:hypothetical protein